MQKTRETYDNEGNLISTETITITRTQKQIDELRQQAYQNESDPLYFKWQRGEGTEQAWLDKVAEIKTRYPDLET